MRNRFRFRRSWLLDRRYFMRFRKFRAFVSSCRDKKANLGTNLTLHMLTTGRDRRAPDASYSRRQPSLSHGAAAHMRRVERSQHQARYMAGNLAPIADHVPRSCRKKDVRTKCGLASF